MLAFASTMAKADVQSETACYVYVPQGQTSKPIQLAVRIYSDNDLKKEVGAFAQYNDSKEIIPLVFIRYVSTDTDSPELGNYEISRIEVNDRKVTGEYVFVQAGAGNAQGKYVKYKNTKTGKSTIFMHTGDGDPSCKINR